MLALYRRVLETRRRSPALCLGDQHLLEAPDGVLAWTRRNGEDERLVAVNFTDEARTLDAPRSLLVEIASDGAGEGRPFSGELGPSQAVWLRRG